MVELKFAADHYANIVWMTKTPTTIFQITQSREQGPSSSILFFIYL